MRNLHLTFDYKFIYSKKATKFCEISTLLLSYVVPVKSKVETGDFAKFCGLLRIYELWSKVRWRFRKILWPTQNIRTLQNWVLWLGSQGALNLTFLCIAVKMMTYKAEPSQSYSYQVQYNLDLSTDIKSQIL